MNGSGRRVLVRIAMALGVVGVGTAGWLVWHNLIRYEVEPKRFAEVEPGFLYRSGQISSRLIRGVLEDHGIDVVVSLMHLDPSRPDQRAERDAAAAEGVELVNIHLHGDGTGDVDNFADALTRIAEAEKAGQQVLVHCAAGAQRTGAVISAYQLLVEGRPPDVAYRELARYIHDAPSQRRLASYLNRQMDLLADRLVQRGVLPAVPDPLPQLPVPG